MPQGPTSRGCEACRAQKKKCDLAQPTCSRCRRLRITCVGCGKQRFKFSSDRKVPYPQGRPDVSRRPAPIPPPSNETSCLQQAVVSKLQAPNDARYHITFRYGTWLVELPKRLGSNEALDTAVAALLARHVETSMRKDQSDPQAPAVVQYSRALAALRVTLADTRRASSTETLCAAMLLTYCQARFDDQFTFFWSPHGQGIAQLMKTRNFPSGSNLFENYLFGTLHATVLLQSFANPSVRLSTWEYQKLETAFLSAVAVNPNRVHVRHWQLMVHISAVMADARNAIASGMSLNAIAIKANELQRSMQAVLDALHDRLRDVENSTPDQSLDPRIHANCQRIYGGALATMSILLCIRRQISPSDLTVHDTATNICFEVLRICHDARAYRPVGAVWTVHTLICVWCATQDVILKGRIEDELLDYQRDAMGPTAKVQTDKLELLERRLSLLE